MRLSRKPDAANSSRELLGRALLAANRHHQHLDIEQLGGRRARLVGHHHLADQHAAMFRQLLAHEVKNGAAVLVAPIVDDVLEKIGVASVGHAFEEASGLGRYASFAAGELLLRHMRHHLGTIEQHALHVGLARRIAASSRP